MAKFLEIIPYIAIFISGIITGSILNRYLSLGGLCRMSKVSIHTHLIEAANGVWYVLVFICNGFHPVSILYSLMGSALLALSIIDFCTFKIPPVFPCFIMALGVVRIVIDWQHWYLYITGAVSVSGLLCILFLVTKGRAIGGGDVKLMAASGLLIGWERLLLAFWLACILGSVLHLIRMKFSGEGHVLALGPYLSAGLMISILWGKQWIDWYVSMS